MLNLLPMVLEMHWIYCMFSAFLFGNIVHLQKFRIHRRNENYDN